MSEPANQNAPSSFPRRYLLGLLVVSAPMFFLGLGRLPLLEPDEGRNAEVAREMLATGHWLVPHFNSLPYLDKPVVFFWMVAGSFRALGLSEAAARLPSALAALGTVLVVWLLARRLFDERTAFRAGLILATAPLFFLYARIVIFDMTLTFLMTLAMLIFWVASSEDFRRPWLDAALFAVLGVATLTKGPVGFLIPLLSILVYRLFRPRGLRLKRLRWGLGAAVFLAIVLPWFLAVTWRYPDFPRYVFLFESLERFASGEAHRPGGVFYYLPVYLGGFFPWSLCLLFAGWNRLRRWREWKQTSSPVLFLLAWAGLIFVFFTLSRSKLPGYFLPAMAPLSLLMARVWSELDERRDAWAPDWLTGGFAALIAAGILLALGAWQMGHFMHLRVVLHRKVPPGVLPLLEPTLIYTGLIVAALGILGRNLVQRLHGPRLAAVALGLMAILTPFLALRWIGPVEAYAEVTSSRRLGRTILASPERNLPIYGYYYFRTGLPFYLRRPVHLITNDGGEMTSNYIALHWRAAHRAGSHEGSADMFHGLLVDVNQFQARARADAGPTLVLIRDFDDPDLQSLFPHRTPLPLWNEWRDAVWEVAARKH